ncbi:MAG: FAD-dependent oxidoreductase [bacterium]|nr:FAD-dependent oxidoreductase [bacterium]
MSSLDKDVVVIGGGVQGIGVVQAIAAAGHSVLLLERKHVAIGTSSRSSKLIHGGLRYLESAQFELVRESLRERRILLEIAPHLVRLVPFNIPVYRETTRKPWQIRAGLSLYALLGNLRKTARFTKVARRDWDTLEGLTTDNLRAVYRYFDGQTDDAALCRAVLASARELGAEGLMDAEVVAAERAGDGWRVRYTNAGAEHEVTARVVVNAGGPWANRVLDRMTPAPPRRAIELVAGTHVEYSGKAREGIYYTEAEDHRAVFILPWKGRTLVGTTEQPYDSDPALVAPTEHEIEYLDRTLLRYFPAGAGERVDTWAGLRVLPAGKGSAFSRPREVILETNDEDRPSIVTIYGGKLTGYRHTAQRVLDCIEAGLPAATRRADTATLRLPADPQRVTVRG